VIATNSARLALGLLTIVPVGHVPEVDRRLAERSMRWIVPVGALLGVAAASVLTAGQRVGLAALTAAVLAVATLAALTRGLHLDGLADTADGLGSRRPARQAIAVMRTSDIGPFGVTVLVLVLLIQVFALAEASWRALIVSVVVGRLSILVCCSRGVAAARADGLGALVAGTVSRQLLVVTSLATGAGAAVVVGWRGPLAVVLGLTITFLLVRHCVRRLGGVTGDVIGAAVELATAVALVVLAAG
jgi:adenosylcobinamide-GDP ribazoletransferase